MFVPFLLFLISVAALGVAILMPGLTDLWLLAGPCTLAAMILLAQAWLRHRKARPRSDRAWGWPGRRRKSRTTWVLVDGSNVMHWRDGTPQIAPVREVVDRLKALGLSPLVMFDANAGYKISGRYKHDYAFGQMLGLPESRVFVVDKGTPADPALLAAARDLGGRIVTNDRYRDWVETHPELAEPGHLIRGGYRDGALWLEIG